MKIYGPLETILSFEIKEKIRAHMSKVGKT